MHCDRCGARYGDWVIRRRGDPSDYLVLGVFAEGWQEFLKRFYPAQWKELWRWTEPEKVQLGANGKCLACEQHEAGRAAPAVGHEL